MHIYLSILLLGHIHMSYLYFCVSKSPPATDLSMVHEILTQTLKIKNTPQLPYILIVFDQALYAKATDILWKHKDRFPGVIPRMGTFHTICTLLGIIGKRFQDAGLHDLCIEAGVIAEGSVAGVLEDGNATGPFDSISCCKILCSISYGKPFMDSRH